MKNHMKTAGDLIRTSTINLHCLFKKYEQLINNFASVIEARVRGEEGTLIREHSLQKG